MQNKIIVKSISEHQRVKLIGEWKKPNKELKSLETRKGKIYIKMRSIEKKVSRESQSD